MKATQSYVFVRNKKDISLSKQTLTQALEIKDSTILSHIAKLPDLNISDDSIPHYITLLSQLIPKSEPKIKEKIYYLLCYLLNVQKNNQGLLTQFIRDFRTFQEPTLFKVKMATLLFKSVENKEFKKELLIESIKLLANEAKLTNLISLLQTIDPILSELSLSENQLAEIYELSIKSLEKYPLYKNLTINLILKLLRLPSDKLDAAIVERSLLYLIQNATVNEQIVQLSQSNLQETLPFTLFKLLLSGDLELYQRLASQKKEDISKLNLNISDYERQLKVNSISKLASTNKTLKYSEISEKLNIPKEEVETYIITAIQNNIISARIDEIEEVVTVEEIKSKYFSQDQWVTILAGIQSLESKLEKFVGKEEGRNSQ